MTARTVTPPAVAEALIDAQLRALENRLHVYRNRVRIVWRNPLDDRGIRGLERTLVAAAALERTASEITAIEREAGRGV